MPVPARVAPSPRYEVHDPERVAREQAEVAKRAADNAYAASFDQWITKLARLPAAERIIQLDRLLVGEADVDAMIRDEPGRRGRRDAYREMTGVDPEARREAAVVEARERDAAQIAARLANVPTLKQQFPDVRCPVIVVRSEVKLQGDVLHRGDRVDLADYRWRSGKLRRQLTLGDGGAGSQWFRPVPGEQEAIDRAIAANEGFFVAPARDDTAPVHSESHAHAAVKLKVTTSHSFEPVDESAEDRKRRQAAERQRRRRALKKEAINP
jgi:hypothetical protein